MSWYTATKETKETDSATTFISSGTRSAFMEYMKSVLQQLDEQRSSAGTPPCRML